MDNLTSGLDLNRIINSVLTRCAIFVFSLGLLAAVDIQANRIMLDADSIYPFLIMLLTPASLALKLGVQAITIIRRCCVPIGVFICALNIVAIVTNMSEPSDYFEGQRLLYAPAALGIILSLLFRLIEPTGNFNFRLSKSELFAFYLIFLGCTVASSTLILGAETPISSAWNSQAALIAITVWAICIAHPEYSKLTLYERTKKASLGIILISAISGVSLWTFIVATRDLEAFGSIFAVPVIGFLNGSWLAIFATSVSASEKRQETEDKFFDWHVIESYAFYLLIVAPPLSIRELFTDL